MCFFTRGSRIRIATKDIVCYKLVVAEKDYCISRFQNFRYEYNKKYSGKSKLILFLMWLFNFNVTYEAYHSHIYECKDSCSHKRVKCVIPKGSLYLVNELDRKYCSTSIKVLKP